MEGVYFFGEYVRWNLGWNNPNQAGAFIAMWLPWIWGTFDLREIQNKFYSRFLFTSVLIVEAVLWFLLSKTYSRGALLAAVMGALVYGVFIRTKSVGHWSFRLAMVCGIVIATGLFGRIDPNYVTQDDSSMNRLTLWKGGLQMISASPWKGWGIGRSGQDYMHWFQPFDSNLEFGGMVNSYLHVAVERGLPVLGVCVALAAGLLILSCRIARRQGRAYSLTASAGACLCVFFVANVFSTLWIFPNLWWVPGFAGLWILARFASHDARGRCGKAALMGATLVFSVAILTSFIMELINSKNLKQTAIRLSGNKVICGPTEGSHGTLILLPDSSVLGERWGKEIRRLSIRFPDVSIIVPQKRSANIRELISSDSNKVAVIACGNTAANALMYRSSNPNFHLILVHPTGKPPFIAVPLMEITVFVPELDTARWGHRWMFACRRNGWDCHVNKGVGQDARVVWPDIMDQAIGSSPMELVRLE